MGTDTTVDMAARITGTTTDIASRVTNAIRDAAKATGAGFDYLLSTAVRESNLNPNAKSPNSSATGLFQFLDQSWLATLKQSGPALGYGKYADAITRTASGRYVISDPSMQQQVMTLRKDPTANAVMAGALANSNTKMLTQRLGRPPTDGELYIAHFLGPAGAVRLINGAQTQPNASAASMFPRAAQANSPIFYDRKTGAARSLSQVYNVLVARQDAITSRFAGAEPASAPAAITAALAAPAPAVSTPAPLPAAPPLVAAANDTALPATAEAYTMPAPAPARPQAPQPLFLGLYQTENRGAVAPVVRELWGPRSAAMPDTPTAVAPAAATTAPPTEPAKAPLSLFQFLRPEIRGAA